MQGLRLMSCTADVAHLEHLLAKRRWQHEADLVFPKVKVLFCPVYPVFVLVADVHLPVVSCVCVCVCLCVCLVDFSVRKQWTKLADGSFESLSALVGPNT